MAAMKITLRAARINLGLTRKEAAKYFGVHHMSITRYEEDSTNVPHSFFSKLESVYGIPIENIFFGKEEEYVQTMRDILFKEVNAIS